MCSCSLGPRVAITSPDFPKTFRDLVEHSKSCGYGVKDSLSRGKIELRGAAAGVTLGLMTTTTINSDMQSVNLQLYTVHDDGV